jgi:hypothetical protein
LSDDEVLSLLAERRVNVAERIADVRERAECVARDDEGLGWVLEYQQALLEAELTWLTYIERRVARQRSVQTFQGAPGD